MRATPFILVMLFACTASRSIDERVAIEEVLQAQQEAWNKGDIPGFMQGYSDTVCFIGSKGTICGKESVTANYLEGYPDREAMGALEFGLSEILQLDGSRAWVTGTWELQRRADTLGGGFTLFWVKEGGDWRIVRDHSY